MSLDKKIEELGYEIVMGVETHVQLNTKTKLFCSCDNQESTIPNENICAICTGQMGTLPELNKAAVEKSIILGAGLNAKMRTVVIPEKGTNPEWSSKAFLKIDSLKDFKIEFLS